MWPWEHLAFGYLLYSAWTHLRHRAPPADAAAVALAVAALLPDLIDKPLGWELGLVSGGRTVAHSLLFAVPLVVVVAVIARRRGVAPAGGGFATGYLSHLFGDVLTPLLLGGDVWAGFLLWPFVRVTGAAAPPPDVPSLLADYLAYVTSSRGVVLLLFEVAFLGAALWLWVADGTPGRPGRVDRGGRE